jgi:preprotein translocase subunit YajC
MRQLIAAIFASFAAAPALAQDAADAPAAGLMQGGYASLLPLVMIFFIFYFLLIRPQQRKFKEHQLVLANLKKGDMVITGGGKIGKVLKIDGDIAHVELAPGVEVKVLKTTISGLHGTHTAIVTATPEKGSKKKNPAVKNDNIVPSKEDVANDN